MSWPAAAMIVGGTLWVVYGVFEMIKPFGIAEVWQPDLRYELITNALLYRVYGVPGALALVLTSFGLVASATLSGRLAAVGRVLAYATLAAGVLSGVGLALGVRALSFGSIAFGTPVLGVAAVLVGAGRGPVWDAIRTLLLAVGLLGLFHLPLLPLVLAVGIIPHVVGAAIIGLFGLGWVALGWVHAAAKGLSPSAIRPFAPPPMNRST